MRQVRIEREKEIEKKQRGVGRGRASRARRGRASWRSTSRGRAGRRSASRGRAGSVQSSRASPSPPGRPRSLSPNIVANSKENKYLICIGINREPPVAAEGFANISKFASKMLERYGFQEGQGLGKNNQGIPGALRVEKLTDKGGVIVAGDEEVKLEEFTLVPGTAGSKNKANKGFINFIPAPENKDLKPLQVENNFSEAIVKRHFWPARKKKTAVPQNPYFNEKIRRRQVETGHLNGSADDPPPNPYFVRTRAKANSYKQYFIKIFPYNVCDGSPAPAARPARRAAPSGKTKNNCNNRNNQVSCTVLNCCWAGGGNLTLLRGLGRVPAWRWQRNPTGGPA